MVVASADVPPEPYQVFHSKSKMAQEAAEEAGGKEEGAGSLANSEPKQEGAGALANSEPKQKSGEGGEIRYVCERVVVFVAVVVVM